MNYNLEHDCSFFFLNLAIEARMDLKYLKLEWLKQTMTGKWAFGIANLTVCVY